MRDRPRNPLFRCIDLVPDCVTGDNRYGDVIYVDRADFAPPTRYEMGTTRRILEVVPNTNAEWKPHPKSSTLGNLVAHLATFPVWQKLVAERAELDLGLPENAAVAQVPFTSRDELLQRFDRDVRDARSALEPMSDEKMGNAGVSRIGGRRCFHFHVWP